ncbi:MAG: ATP-dependent DNA ligase [Gemmatimonas sp.]|nr:ATP-dependent DNA ligase [Gemmatimonas sp.]
MSVSDETRRIGGHEIELSNLDKVFFPDPGITKGDLIAYYDQVADHLLRYAAGRIVTMQRYPDGVEGKSFYQKEVPDYFPHWIRTVKVEKENGSLRQAVLEDRATLVYLANQGCIPLHIWPSLADRRMHPDRLIFDLDPSDDDVTGVRLGARTLRDVLEEVDLVPFLMTSGSRGFHVVVPLNQEWDFDRVRDFASLIATIAAEREPDRLTVETRKKRRKGRVFIDVLRNAYAQHSVAPYAVRALPEAPIATPLEWDELDDVEPRTFTIQTLPERLGRRKDPWAGIGRHARSLEGSMGAAQEGRA